MAASRLEKEMEAITRALYEWEEDFMRKVTASGLTARQMHHLDAIALLGNPSPSEIAEKQGLTRPSVTDLISRLASAGHVRKSKSDVDRRGYHVHVTPKGMAFVEEHRAVHTRLASLFTSALSPRDVDTLEALVRKVMAVMNKGKKTRTTLVGVRSAKPTNRGRRPA
jgi:DNA-binding MarR family transcriptional regulator